MRKRLLSLLLAALLLAATGCADLDAPSDSDPYDPLSELYPTDEQTQGEAALRSFSLPMCKGQALDPITCGDGTQQVIGALLYEGLFALDRQFEPRPALAASCSVSGNTCTVTLRSDARFSDGSAVTAEDVAVSLRRAQDSVRYGGRLAEVTEIAASGSAVRLTLAAPIAAFESRLDIPIVKAGTEGDAVPVGTGRYRYAQEDGAPCLLPNPYRDGAAQLPFDRIGLTVCKDADAALYSFSSRQTQLYVCDFTATGVPVFSGSGDCTDAPTAVMQFLGFNTASPLFSDAALRSAVSLGVDREVCVSAYLMGHGTPAQFPVSPASALYPAALEVDFAPDDYAAALDAAGLLSGAGRSAVLLVNAENEFRVRTAQKIAEDLSAGNFRCTVSALPWEEYCSALERGEFDLYYGECRLNADWDLLPLLAEGGALSYTRFADEELTNALTACRTAGADGRAAAMETLCRQLQSKAPFLPVCFKNISVLLPTDTVEGVSPTAADPFFALDVWTVHWASEDE